MQSLAKLTKSIYLKSLKTVSYTHLDVYKRQLLIEMGFSALAIADRVGHESVDITYKYAHLFPSK